jgi:Na+-translocating ferredoxin:NAD+ oxidoreductase subunit E
MNATAKTMRFDSIVQLLALCPLLAVSDTVVKAIGASAAALIVIPLSTALIGLVRRWLDEEITLAASLLVLAGLVGCVQLLMQARFPDLGAALGPFLPLLAVNVIVADHVSTAHADGAAALRRAVVISVGIALTLLVLGIARELVGRGSLLYGTGSMLAAWVAQLEINVFRVDMGFLLAMLPPGAFISLGLLIALRNWMTARHQ